MTIKVDKYYTPELETAAHNDIIRDLCLQGKCYVAENDEKCCSERRRT
jgi:hypothetical protein